MHAFLRRIGLLITGFAAGAAAALAALAVAQERPGRLAVSDMERIATVMQRIRESFVREETDRRLVDACLGGMAAGIDPDSEYLDADAMRDLQSSSPSLGGTGFELRFHESERMPVVVGTLDGSPAALGGVQAGDLIEQIDGVAVRGRSLVQVVRMLRGPVGSTASLHLLRSIEGRRDRVTVTLTRAILRAQTVRSRRTEDGLLHVRVSQFQERTGSDFGSTLARELREAPPRGIVLDLRGNSGGLLDVAVGVASAFLPPQALVMRMNGRGEEANKEWRATPRDYQRFGDDFLRNVPAQSRTLPMVVLVDRWTAAGAELVAGALKDHHRARIIGEPTYGRGSIQTLFTLPDRTALKLTTSHWATPGGRLIHNQGIEVDVHVPGRPGTPGAEDAAMAAAVRLLEAR